MHIVLQRRGRWIMLGTTVVAPLILWFHVGLTIEFVGNLAGNTRFVVR